MADSIDNEITHYYKYVKHALPIFQKNENVTIHPGLVTCDICLTFLKEKDKEFFNIRNPNEDFMIQEALKDIQDLEDRNLI